MAKPRKQHRDAMYGVIEDALEPDNYIGWNEGSSFVSGVEEVERQIGQLVASDPTRAIDLYESFIAGCIAKADEVDDSDGEFGAFAGGLYLGWIKARQAAGSDSGETIAQLFDWMEDDSYGFCNDLGTQAVSVLDRPGLAALEREARVRVDSAVLKAIYTHKRDTQKYIELTAAAGLTPDDCQTLAAMFQTKRKFTEALDWLERGLKIEGSRFAGHNLAEMRRALLVKLGRAGDALDSAWTEFQKAPNRFSYEELVRYVPKKERAEWHEKAMVAAEKADLDLLIELWVHSKEIDRLARRLAEVKVADLERLSHYVTEPAAERLAKPHPAVAAKLFRALCMRILKAGKSNYYLEALSNLKKARDCYGKVGLDTEWHALTDEIRRDHKRKSSFMPGFERIVAGTDSAREPSFLDRARQRYGRGERS